VRVEGRNLEESVDAFRRATARHADGLATRARVLATAGRRQRRRLLVRRAAITVAVGLVATLSGSAAWTAIGRWRVVPRLTAPAGKRPVVPPAPRIVAADAPRPPTASTAVPPADPARPATRAHRQDDGEARAYGRAHAAHFQADDPIQALALWDAYLRAFPAGALVPEARFNRALCLLRIGRREDARAALAPFLDGKYGGYRRRQAETLRDWLGEPVP
jgi:hypothetical protein